MVIPSWRGLSTESKMKGNLCDLTVSAVKNKIALYGKNRLPSIWSSENT